jgi:hypothetical protein
MRRKMTEKRQRVWEDAEDGEEPAFKDERMGGAINDLLKDSVSSISWWCVWRRITHGVV